MKTAFHWFLAAGMLVTGSINTLGTSGLVCASECRALQYGVLAG